MNHNKHFPFSSFLIFISLLFFPCDAQTCNAPPSSCGTIHNISYPFRLKTDPPNCGVSVCELSCESNQTFIYLKSVGRYYVDSISYQNQTIRLIDFELANSICPLSGNTLTLYYGTSSNIGLHITESLAVFFLNCSGRVGNLDYKPLLCFNSSQEYHAYFYVGEEVTMQDLDEVSCRILAAVPVREEGLGNNVSFAAIRSLLGIGFDIEWYDALGNYCNDYYAFPIFFYMCAHRRISTFLYYCNFIVILLIVRVLFGVFFSLHLLAYKLDWRHQSTDTIEGFLENHQSLTATRYSYSEIKIMTDDFREKLGAGGFGSVYKGTLWNGHLVAVKILSKAKGSGDDFINEVSTIGRIHHVNVVRLLGFCSEGSKRALVYEFMPNGSLEKYIFSKAEKDYNLSWEKLFEIALGTARGIDYLHRGCDVRILHFDIKPHNILLDKSFRPKVSDFGLAKLCPVDYSIVSMTLAARGTIGYIAPELFSRNFGGVSYKSDVYSFGMLLLEMAGKRKNVNAYADKTSQVYFPSWVYDRLNQGGDLEIDQITGVEEEIVKKMAMVGLWCIQMKPIDRPSMREVLEMLEGSIELLQMPPKPFLTSPRRQSNRGLSSMESEIEVDAGMETDTTVFLDVSMSRSI